MGLGLLVGAAGFAGGGFLGFLFGVPRIHTSEAAGDEAAVLSNTNLEQVSDWLAEIHRQPRRRPKTTKVRKRLAP